MNRYQCCLCSFTLFFCLEGTVACAETLRFKNLNHAVQKCRVKYRPVLLITAQRELQAKRLWGCEKAGKMRRSRFEIVAGILQACLLPRGKTRIMCKVKLNFAQANEYLSQLTSLRLLSHEKHKYKTTDKGRQFILAYNHLGEIIGMPHLSLTGMNILSPLAHAHRRF